MDFTHISSFASKYLLLVMQIYTNMDFIIAQQYTDGYMPYSMQWQEDIQKFQKDTAMARSLIDNTTELKYPTDWHSPENYHHKVAKIIRYETSANIHFPGTEEYKRRRVRDGICTNIFPDMIVVPRSDEDVTKIVQISNIVGVPISVTSEGHSYNVCKGVKPEFRPEFLPYTEGIHLDIRHENDFGKGDTFIGSVPSTNFDQKIVDYKEVARVVRTTTFCEVHLKGSPMYETRRKGRYKNGMCRSMLPDLIVMPKSTEDVSKIVKIARHYNIPISVKSGGHSYICQSIKHEGIHVDMRKMNKVKLTNRAPFNHCPPGPAALLGPGSTWGRVLKKIPRDKFTYVHGQCLEVGVGGYLLGGGVNVLGTSQRLTSGANNVLQYTLVDAEGDIYKVSVNNITKFDTKVQRWDQMSGGDRELFHSLQIAGPSYGIVTEFHYGLFEGPEVLPVFALVYLENKKDIANFERAGLAGRYHLTVHAAMYFTKMHWGNLDRMPETTMRLITKALPLLHKKKVEPVVVTAVDNFPTKNQKSTSIKEVFKFLRYHGLKIAIDSVICNSLQAGRDLSFPNYDMMYMDTKTRKKVGPQNVVTANFMNIKSLSSIDRLLMNHPLFGMKNIGSSKLDRSGCDFCFLVVVAWNMSIPRPDPMNAIKSVDVGNFQVYKNAYLSVDVGNFQVEMSCLYNGEKNSKCPTVVHRAKSLFENSAIKSGERFTQYINTPSCDTGTKFWNRYWSKENYEMLLRSKKYWDPENVFNYCHSVGSATENCCPKMN